MLLTEIISSQPGKTSKRHIAGPLCNRQIPHTVAAHSLSNMLFMLTTNMKSEKFHISDPLWWETPVTGSSLTKGQWYINPFQRHDVIMIE